jgi:hypothetical protein
MRTRKRWFTWGSQKPTPVCQCEDPNTKEPCKNEPLEGSLFCQEHQTCPGSPQSGSEPQFNPQKYNQDPTIYKVHNCYAYGMNVLDKESVRLCRKHGDCRRFFHQPGALHGDRNALNVNERRNCKMVEQLQNADNPSIQKSSFHAQCPLGTSKIALVVDPGEDYHYYRQDADGMWSHKDGSNKVKRFDALKRPIFNPELASRDYEWQNSDLNYEDFCGFYCVPRDQSVRLGRAGGVGGVLTRKVQKSRKVQKVQKSRKGRKAQVSRKARKVQRS